MYRFILMTAAFTVAKTQRALEQESKSMSPGNVTLPIPTKREIERERETQRHKIKVHSTISTQRLSVHTASVYVFMCVCFLVYCVVYYIHRSYIKEKRGTRRYIRHKYKKVKVHKVQSFYFYGNNRTCVGLFFRMEYGAML